MGSNMEIEYIKREYQLSELTGQVIDYQVNSVYRYVKYCIERKKIKVDANCIYIKRRTQRSISRRSGIKRDSDIAELIVFFFSKILEKDLSEHTVVFGDSVIENIIMARTRDTGSR